MTDLIRDAESFARLVLARHPHLPCLWFRPDPADPQCRVEVSIVEPEGDDWARIEADHHGFMVLTWAAFNEPGVAERGYWKVYAHPVVFYDIEGAEAALAAARAAGEDAALFEIVTPPSRLR